jgi:aspartyl-tRNA(Asn)/glutamyl-tRNA(Gln) amidotransferase subunit C
LYRKGRIITDALGITRPIDPDKARFTIGFNSFFTMSLTSHDIARLAKLARLELVATESERLLTQMNDFFGIVEKIRAIDTTGIEPLAHPVAALSDITLRLREDAVTEPNQREANQRSAPAVERGLFLVPKVIE